MPESMLSVTKYPGKKGRWIENRYLPTSLVLVTSEEQSKFLEILTDKRYLETAARAYGVCKRSVLRKMVEFPEFGAAVNLIRDNHRDIVRIELEAISENQAMIPKNVTERIFQLNAKDPDQYRPRQTNIQATSIHVSYGFQSPVAIDRKPEKRVKGAEVKANLTVETPK